MASEFEDLFSDGAADDLMDLYGRAASYKGPSGAEVTGIKVRVIEKDPAHAQTGDDQVKSFSRHAELKVLQSAVSAPVKDGRFTVDSVLWTVISIPIARNGQWVMDVGSTKPDRMAERRVERG